MQFEQVQLIYLLIGKVLTKNSNILIIHDICDLQNAIALFFQ